MDLKSLFGGITIGKDTSGNFKLSFGFDQTGLAVRAPDGQFFGFTKDAGLTKQSSCDLILCPTFNRTQFRLL